MLYRESGDFSETYKADSQTFPIKFDRYRYYAVLIVAFLVIPLVINDYWANAVLVPFFDLCDCRDWAEYPCGLLWPGVLGDGWIYGCGRLCVL